MMKQSRMFQHTPALRGAIAAAMALISVGSLGMQQQRARIMIESPLPDERFVTQEPVRFKAAFAGVDKNDSARASWTSLATAELGRGSEIEVRNLPAGTHEVTVSLDGVSQSVRIREFTDLLELYRAAPAAAELQRIGSAFTFDWSDGSQPDQRWKAYEPPLFDLQSPRPSKIVLPARLDVLRHQTFSEPLPFGDGLPVYEHLRSHVKRFVLRLDCGIASGGGGSISMPRHASAWPAVTCKDDRAGQQPLGYEGPLALVLHEARHNQRGDPGHRACRGHPGLDASLDNGSGFAWSALYFMWVYKYGTFDPPTVKNSARQALRGMLPSSFCSAPSSSNPKVQAIVNEIMAPN